MTPKSKTTPPPTETAPPPIYQLWLCSDVKIHAVWDRATIDALTTDTWLGACEQPITLQTHVSLLPDEIVVCGDCFHALPPNAVQRPWTGRLKWAPTPEAAHLDSPPGV